jgi:hypothetical protein
MPSSWRRWNDWLSRRSFAFAQEKMVILRHPMTIPAINSAALLIAFAAGGFRKVDVGGRRDLHFQSHDARRRIPRDRSYTERRTRTSGCAKGAALSPPKRVSLLDMSGSQPGMISRDGMA